MESPPSLEFAKLLFPGMQSVSPNMAAAAAAAARDRTDPRKPNHQAYQKSRPAFPGRKPGAGKGPSLNCVKF